MRQSQAQTEKAEAIARLREWLKPGDTVYTILRHVSRSGMQREISVAKVVDGRVIDLDYNVARALGQRVGKHGGLVMGGCGMDMGFALVYELSSVLYPDGFECVGRDDARRIYCPSNDHTNGDRDFTPHHHSSGGYALKHAWL